VKRRIFISAKAARKAGRRATEGRALRFKIEPYFIFNKDRTVDQGWQVSLWSMTGLLHRGFIRE
jgi:hypothetical protein